MTISRRTVRIAPPTTATKDALERANVLSNIAIARNTFRGRKGD